MKTYGKRQDFKLLTPSVARWRFVLGFLAILITGSVDVPGFSLLGPYAAWMDPTNSYRAGLDIGGPVGLSEGYRWNVPFVTYGFDQSFINYFGSNGVYAVGQAFQVLNDLTPASDLNPTNFPTGSYRYNYSAADQQVFDLKTATLAVLLEHMGLSEPERNMFVLYQWSSMFLADLYLSDYSDSFLSEYILERNFDPQSLAPSTQVNGVPYMGEVFALGPLNPNPRLAYGHAQIVDPLAVDQTAATDLIHIVLPIFTTVGFNTGGDLLTGAYFSTFSQDDIGGIRYLLSTNNVEPEILLPDVYGTGSNTTWFVNGALRPGINKINFVRQPYDIQLGRFLSLTNDFTDSYFTNGSLQHQQLERVTTEPDFLFSVTDTAGTNAQTPLCVRSGTDHWWNSAAGNSSTALGPGLIRPPIHVVFNKLGPWLQTDEYAAQGGAYSFRNYHWASFDGTTNAIVTYPVNVSVAATNDFAVHLWLTDFSAHKAVDWYPSLPAGTMVSLQTSSNLIDWVSITTITNTGGPVMWRHWYLEPAVAQRYFRLAPK
jgi:hypothetical protein